MKTNKSNFVKLAAVAIVSSIVTFLLMLGTSNSSARQQQITGTENHVVTLDQAVKLVQNYSLSPSAPTLKGGLFARSIFDKILVQNGCVGIRYYYAKKDDGTATLVLVGVDNTGNDMTAGVLGDQVFPCPPYCGVSVLNR